MPVLDANAPESPPTPTWAVRASTVVDWFWALLVHDDETGYPLRQARFAAFPGLTERILTFWSDGDREFIELVYLARRAGCLWDPDAARILTGLRAVIGSPADDETFDSESPEDAAAIRARLARLRRDPQLAEAWLSLIEEVATALAPLQAENRAAAETAVRAILPGANRANGWPSSLHFAGGPEWADPIPALARRAAAVDGEVVLVPSRLGRKRFYLSFGDLLLLGVLAGGPVQPSDATRETARALRALADPTRLTVVEQLAIRPRGVGELARDLAVSQPTISNHVRILRDAGLVTDGPRGGPRVLLVDPAALEAILADVRSIALGGPNDCYNTPAHVPRGVT